MEIKEYTFYNNKNIKQGLKSNTTNYYKINNKETKLTKTNNKIIIIKAQNL